MSCTCTPVITCAYCIAHWNHTNVDWFIPRGASVDYTTASRRVPVPSAESFARDRARREEWVAKHGQPHDLRKAVPARPPANKRGYT